MSNATKEPTGNGALAKAEPTNPTVIVGDQIQRFMTKGTLHLPSDYSPENALKSAWLALQQIDGALTCTKESIINSLLDMCIQGLNPAKKQCYFIPYGKTLSCQRSYFGEMALAERVCPGISIFSDVIYKGETFTTAKVRNKHGFVTVVAKHEQPFPRESSEIIGAYCGATEVDPVTGEIIDLGIELMDMAQIQNSWKKSKTISPKSFHNEQPDQACQRTVIRRWAKFRINASNDALLLTSVRRQDEDAVIAESNNEALELGNGQLINVEEPQALEPKAEATPPPDEPVTAKQAELVEEPGF